MQLIDALRKAGANALAWFTTFWVLIGYPYAITFIAHAVASPKETSWSIVMYSWLGYYVFMLIYGRRVLAGALVSTLMLIEWLAVYVPALARWANQMAARLRGWGR